jgi:hypothetical protein
MASKTVVEALVTVDVERCCLFVMKWAESDVAATLLLEPYVL